MRVSTRLSDFREIDGVVLPFRATAKYASPMLGAAETTIEEAKTAGQVDPGVFTTGTTG